MSESKVRGDALWEIFKEATDSECLEVSAISPTYHELSTITEAYSDQSVIGAGTLKVVTKCFDERMRRYVAYAELQAHLGVDYYDAFIHEAQLVAALSHPNIIKVHELNIDPKSGRPYFTMDLRSSRDLRRLVEEGASLRVRLDAFLRVCDAVAYAHSRRTLHLDLKPENIQCESFGEVVVCDWGLGRRIGEETLTEEAIIDDDILSAFDTLYGKVRGTPGFMAPEQIHGEGEKDERTDIFALGAILYFLIKGQAPFVGSRAEILESTLLGKSGEEGEGVERSILAVSIKALSADPEQRYQKVGLMKQDLERCLTGYAPEAQHIGVLEKGILFMKRNRRECAVFAVVVGMLSLFTFIYQKGISQKDREVTIESGRADDLASQVRALNEEYRLFENAMQESDRELADRLRQVGVQSMLELMGVYQNSQNRELRSTFSEATVLLEKSMKLSVHEPLNHNRITAYEYWAMANLFMLNLGKILEVENISPNPALRDFQRYAEKFSHFRYGVELRPSIEELSSFLQYAFEEGSITEKKLETIMRFDWDCRSDYTGYNQIILMFLEVYNRQDPSFTISYDPIASHIQIYTDRHFVHRSKASADHKSLLSLLRARSMSLVSPRGGFDLSALDACEFEYVDLYQIHKIHLTKPLHSPRLKSARVRSSVTEVAGFQAHLQESTLHDQFSFKHE